MALDVGGTKLAAAVVAADGSVLRSGQVPTPPAAVGDEVFAALLGVAEEVLTGDQPAAVGVGCGGPMAWPAGEVSPLNIPGWRGFPLRARLTQRFPDRPVRLHNDAVALAAAEHWQGAARGHDDALAMVVATGVGGGLVLGGRLVDGATGNAGHVGHVVVDPEGPACTCGGRGCLEAIARGPALAAWAVQHGWRPSGEQTARAMADDARAGDPAARSAFDRGGRAIGIAVASVVQSLDVSVVVVGGGLAGAWDLLDGPLSAAYHRHAGLAFARVVPVVRSGLGPSAGLVGAAALVIRGDVYWHGDG